MGSNKIGPEFPLVMRHASALQPEDTGEVAPADRGAVR